jgi:lysine 6-dehydrogenase
MKTYAIIGSGMQGTAAAYDLAVHARAVRIYTGDMDADQARKSAERVNALVGRPVCEPRQLDAMNPTEVAAFLKGVDTALSCLPYWMHPHVEKVAVEQGVSVVDLGGNTDVTMQTLALDSAAKAAGVTLVPDTGLAPGLVNNLGCYIIERLDKADTVKMYCGVLPQHPIPPLNYKLTFHMEGLVAEYDYEAVVLRDGTIQRVPTLTEVEPLLIDELGQMEAFVTSGGTSTAPYTFEGKVRNYEYKTIRYPRHGELMKLFKDFGFWSEDEVDVRGQKVRPKDVFNAVFGPMLSKYEDRDMCAVRAVGTGTKDGQPTRIQIDIIDRECEKTGFTSMARLTGFSCAIVAREVAEGRVPRGAIRYETAMTGKAFLTELLKRGINIRISECKDIQPDV